MTSAPLGSQGVHSLPNRISNERKEGKSAGHILSGRFSSELIWGKGDGSVCEVLVLLAQESTFGLQNPHK